MDKINYELRRYQNAVMRSIKVVTGKKINFWHGEKTFFSNQRKYFKKSRKKREMHKKELWK